jgi:hypothetical protein
MECEAPALEDDHAGIVQRDHLSGSRENRVAPRIKPAVGVRPDQGAPGEQSRQDRHDQAEPP